MEAGLPDPQNRPGLGLFVATASYAMFSLQDATVKWLVQDFSVFQILFTRSLVVVVVAAAVGGKPALRDLRASHHKASLALRSGLILLAWFLFFTAARRLGLAELTTIYFVAPVITVILSVLVLKETVGPGRWLAVLVGFAGVAMAARPGSGAPLGPVLLTFGAAAAWSFSGVLGRLISRTEGTLSQMIASNALFVLSCALVLPGVWRMPGLFDATLLLGLGLAGGVAQLLMYESYRLAPASLVASTEYTAFLWAFLLGFAIWGEIPAASVWAGAALILCGGILLLWSERARLLRPSGHAAEALLRDRPRRSFQRASADIEA